VLTGSYRRKRVLWGARATVASRLGLSTRSFSRRRPACLRLRKRKQRTSLGSSWATQTQSLAAKPWKITWKSRSAWSKIGLELAATTRRRSNWSQDVSATQRKDRSWSKIHSSCLPTCAHPVKSQTRPLRVLMTMTLRLASKRELCRSTSSSNLSSSKHKRALLEEELTLQSLTWRQMRDHLREAILYREKTAACQPRNSRQKRCQISLSLLKTWQFRRRSSPRSLSSSWALNVGAQTSKASWLSWSNKRSNKLSGTVFSRHSRSLRSLQCLNQLQQDLVSFRRVRQKRKWLKLWRYRLRATREDSSGRNSTRNLRKRRPNCKRRKNGLRRSNSHKRSLRSKQSEPSSASRRLQSSTTVSHRALKSSKVLKRL